MTGDDRRRFGAVAAIAVGVFLGLALLPVGWTGTVGSGLSRFLWTWLGIGAVGLPLLGLAIGLAGFDRLPLLDMKRAAILVAGLSFLLPFLVGVIAKVTVADMDAQTLPARLTGAAPGAFVYYIVGAIGQAGGLLVGFLALSGLTLGTLAWHPLKRLERGEVEAPSAPVRRARARPASSGDDEDEEEAEAPLARPTAPRGAVTVPKAARPAPAGPVAPGPPLTGTGEILPELALLASPPPHDTARDEAKLDQLGELLLEALRTFKVDCTIAGRTSGPVVTQFEVVPAAGVKVGRIVALSDDLAIKMRAPSVRVAAIPGKGAVGVEIPNPTARIVTLRELLEAAEWQRSRATLPMALGRDLEGRAVVTDLAKTPHLLIAGATGSGKSVTVNTIVTGLVYRYPPRELQFLMIDPKMVELSMYNALPHMKYPVVTDSRDAAFVLKWAVREMGHRYELLHANGARNIGDFNRKVEEGKPLRQPAPPQRTLTTVSAEPADTPPPAPEPEAYTEGVLPYIVIVVDELADLMMTVQAEVETPLALLAQKARAIGIHLILATQRPSVNVITGLIKANFPSRVAFRVASKVDSRTILDQNGAEALLGNGDMLFLPPGRSEPMRIQAAFIATEETERLMHWFEGRKQAGAFAGLAPQTDIVAQMRAAESEEEGGGDGGEPGERDPLFRQAAEICIQNQGGSTSLLQRRLKIGYGRAARVIDQLHEAGVLGPSEGARGREVLIGMHQLDDYSS
jgi:S-DNA-T family DNA segregation ATPase FtsK/SpoIIIE